MYHHRPGDRVTLHYGPHYAEWATVPQDAPGVVLVRARGPGPRNFAVHLDSGRVVVAVAGNLREVRRCCDTTGGTSSTTGIA